MNNYKFERLSNKNLKDLVFLYQESFNEKTNLEFLQKKYDTHSFGLSFVGYVAYDSVSNEPAAYYGVFPIKVRYFNELILAAQSGDTMTHPNHRGKGLFITLAKMTYELAKNNSVEFIFGFPNENSYGGFIKKLNWTVYANINNYKIKSSALPFEKVAKKFPFFNYFYSKIFLKKIYSKSLFQPFSNSIDSQISNVGFVEHDAHFYNYKTYYRSTIISVEGINCWIKIDGRLWIGDIEYCNKEKFYSVVIGLLSLAKKICCSTIQFSVQENSDYDKWLKEKYDINSQNPVGCLNLGTRLNPENFAYQALDFDTF